MSNGGKTSSEIRKGGVGGLEDPGLELGWIAVRTDLTGRYH